MSRLRWAFAVVLILSCGGSKEQSEDVRLVSAGLEKLKIQAWGEAAEKFNAALQINPDNPQALYGSVIAETLETADKLVALFNDVITMLLQGVISGKESPPVLPSQYAECPKYGITRSIDGLVKGFFLEKLEKNIEKLRKIEELPDFSMYIESIPIKVEVAIISFNFDFGGEHDMGEVYFLDAVFSFIDALMRLFLSINFDIGNILGAGFDIWGYVQENIELLGKRPLEFVSKILVYLLKNSRNFLTVACASDIDTAREQLFNWASKTQKWLDYLMESDDDVTSDDIMFYDSVKKEVYVRYMERGRERVELIFSEGEAKKLEGLSDIFSTHFDKGVGRISFAAHLSPLLGVIVAGFLRSGLLDAIIELGLSALPEDMRAQVEQFLRPEFMSPDLIGGLISGMAGGNIFEFDFYTWFGNLKSGRTSLREWLPAWTGIHDKEFTDMFVIEWECGVKSYGEGVTSVESERLDPGTYGLTCTDTVNGKEVKLGDSKHFSSALTLPVCTNELLDKGLSCMLYAEFEGVFREESSPSDGKAFKGPYFLFRDSSFGGLLWLNIAPITEPGEEIPCGAGEGFLTYGEGDLNGVCALNFVINKLVEDIMGILKGTESLLP